MCVFPDCFDVATKTIGKNNPDKVLCNGHLEEVKRVTRLYKSSESLGDWEHALYLRLETRNMLIGVADAGHDTRISKILLDYLGRSGHLSWKCNLCCIEDELYVRPTDDPIQSWVINSCPWQDKSCCTSCEEVVHFVTKRHKYRNVPDSLLQNATVKELANEAISTVRQKFPTHSKVSDEQLWNYIVQGERRWTFRVFWDSMGYYLISEYRNKYNRDVENLYDVIRYKVWDTLGCPSASI
jgi:hypothetical protein